MRQSIWFYSAIDPVKRKPSKMCYGHSRINCTIDASPVHYLEHRMAMGLFTHNSIKINSLAFVQQCTDKSCSTDTKVKNDSSLASVLILHHSKVAQNVKSKLKPMKNHF